jgi:NAD(P)-dependent dehydrogenase (short-subunit alcohol dehydrogenase family)
MSLLQRTGQVTETDENLLVLKLPDDVTPSRTVKALVRAAVATFGIAGIIISTATLVGALPH